VKAKREEFRLKAVALIEKALAESRFLNEDEEKQHETYEDELRKWDETINHASYLMFEGEAKPKNTSEPICHNPEKDILMEE